MILTFSLLTLVAVGVVSFIYLHTKERDNFQTIVSNVEKDSDGARNIGTNIDLKTIPLSATPFPTVGARQSNSTKIETVRGDLVGVPECDEYLKKYELCMTKIASKAPQAAPGLKTAFEAQRNGFKTAASTPAGKAALAGQCKGFIASAKASTAQWCNNW